MSLLLLASAALAATPLGAVVQPRVRLDEDQAGFEVRRLLITGSGEVSPGVRWKLRADLARLRQVEDTSGKTRSVAGALVDDALVEVRLTGPLTLSLGRAKVPFSEQWTRSRVHALALAERPMAYSGESSLGVSGTSPGRDSGVALRLRQGGLDASLGAWSGVGGLVLPDEPGLLAGARVAWASESLVAGELDTERGDWGVGVGMGAVVDLDGAWRATVGARVSGRGLVATAEGTVRQGDGGPGGYAQLSWVPEGVPLAPAARVSLLGEAWCSDAAVSLLLAPESDHPERARLMLWGRLGSSDEAELRRLGIDAFVAL